MRKKVFLFLLFLIDGNFGHFCFRKENKPFEIIFEKYESNKKADSPLGFSFMLADSTMTVTNFPCILLITTIEEEEWQHRRRAIGEQRIIYSRET